MAFQLRDEATSLFEKSFGYTPVEFSFAPGRVNFIGEHTDYCEGFVCPMAIHLGTVVAGKLVSGNGVVAEVLKKFDREELGFDMSIVSNVPLGGGLSSSASLEVAVALFCEQILGVVMSPEERALLCQRAEHNYPQMPCGIMDQFIASCGAQGHLLLIDCRSVKGELVPMNDASVSVVVCNSNKKHALTGSEYPDRVKQCKQAVEVLKTKYSDITSLRDATMSQIESVKEQMGDVVYRRAMHVVTENERVTQCVTALSERKYETVGQYLKQSHASLRDNFEVSTTELDILVEIACECEGVYGARMTGGGFGGCIVCFVRTDAVKSLCKVLESEYKRKTGIECTLFSTVPSEGAHTMTNVALKRSCSQGHENCVGTWDCVKNNANDMWEKNPAMVVGGAVGVAAAVAGVIALALNRRKH